MKINNFSNEILKNHGLGILKKVDEGLASFWEEKNLGKALVLPEMEFPVIMKSICAESQQTFQA